MLGTDTVYWSPALIDLLAQSPAVWVTVVKARGSVPRAAGTVMAVFANTILGTIGGGRLEFEVIARAQEQLKMRERDLADPDLKPVKQTFALGPQLGQCCGGSLVIKFEPVYQADARRLVDILYHETVRNAKPLALFGGGHVGKALVRVLAPLPFQITWVDSRDEVFPLDVMPNVMCEHSNPVQSAVPHLAPSSRVLIMSFSHAEDFDIVSACLLRQRHHNDLAFIGLIGSATKWATFKRRLVERGFSELECQRVTCPIGLPGIKGKEPQVIAVAVAAQLLQL